MNSLILFVAAFVVYLLLWALIYHRVELETARSEVVSLEARIAWMKREIDLQQKTIRILRDEVGFDSLGQAIQ